MIVNGLIDPDVMCPDGDPDTLKLNEQTYPCYRDGCIVTALEIDWSQHEGTHEMVCVNSVGTSQPLVVEVPELPTGCIVIGLLVLYLLSRRHYGFSKISSRRKNWWTRRTRD